MKKILAVILLFTMAFSLAACGSKEPAAPQGAEGELPTIHLDFATPTSIETAHYYAIEKFCEIVTEKTDGKVTFTIFPSGQLAPIQDQVMQQMEGNIKIGSIDNSGLSAYWPEFNIFNAPFVFTDKTDCDKIVDGELGKQLWAIMEKNGLTVLDNHCWYSGSGFRVITSSKPINSIADMKGLKIRVMENSILLKSWELLGTAATPVAWVELYTALQQGVVDAQENPLDLIYTNKFHEINKYIVMTNHLLQPVALAINTEFFNTLPAEYLSSA